MHPKQAPNHNAPHRSVRQHHNHRLTIRKDVNPATYYMRDRSFSPKGHRTASPHSNTRNRMSTTSSSCQNLLASSHSDSNTNTNKTVSVMNLMSYTDQMSIESYFDLPSHHELESTEYNEFSNHNEFVMNCNGSWSDLYDTVKAKSNNNKKRYKHNKISSNISNYMKYIALNDGEQSDEEYYNEINDDKGNNLEIPTASPSKTTFDSVNDIFNLIPNENEKENGQQIDMNIIHGNEGKEQHQGIEENKGLKENEGNVTNEETEKEDIDFLNKLREILRISEIERNDNDDNDDNDNDDNHDNDGNNDNDTNSIFRSINSLRQNLNDKALKIENVEHEYQSLQEITYRLKQENKALKQKNDELVNQLNLNEITRDNILIQLNRSLSNLKNGIHLVPYHDIDGIRDLYKNFKIKLHSMYESLIDLAKDMESEELLIAVGKLKKSLDDIDFLQHHGLYKPNHLQLVINDLLRDLNKLNHTKQTPQNPENDEIETKYPELLLFNDDNEKNEDDEKEEYMKTNKLSKYGVFDEDIPIIIRIDVDGKWFNKKTRAIIKYKNKIFGRKEADFKWLYKMMQIYGSNGIIPDFCKELPHTLWPSNYLIKRKNELNLFLIQCHSLRHIKNCVPYHVFLEQNKEIWKRKRDQFDKTILQKIKNNQI